MKSFNLLFIFFLAFSELPFQAECQFFTRNSIKAIPRMGKRLGSTYQDWIMMPKDYDSDTLYNYVLSVSSSLDNFYLFAY
jgi:hypothetical protein